MMDSTDILHFPARVPVIQVASGCYRPTTLISDTVLPNYTTVPGLPSFAFRRTGP
jgi:hypothetical protein